MAILHRFGSADEFDPSKMRARELAYVNTTNAAYKAGLYLCYAPGDVRRQTTEQDIIDILNTTPEAYTALQQLLVDLGNNPSELTNILNNITSLQLNKLDKAGDSKDNTVSFAVAEVDSDIAAGDAHATLFGKILKRFATLATSIAGKIDKTSIVQSTEISDATKVPSSVVTASQATQIGNLSTSITTLNNNLANKFLNVSVSTLDSGVATQTYSISKAGYYIICSNVRVFGGSGVYPTYIGVKAVDTTSGDDFGGGLVTQYGWVTLTSIEYLSVGTHSKTFTCGDATTTVFNVRTSLIRIPSN